jgi:2-C-methyl-D-erythritol 2,4-cyclodiphosphate synthase
VLNLDATVVLEAPKLSSFKGQMRARLADALGLEVGFVNVKATRGEGMGFIGRGEGAASLAIATVER